MAAGPPLRNEAGEEDHDERDEAVDEEGLGLDWLGFGAKYRTKREVFCIGWPLMVGELGGPPAWIRVENSGVQSWSKTHSGKCAGSNDKLTQQNMRLYATFPAG